MMHRTLPLAVLAILTCHLSWNLPHSAQGCGNGGRFTDITPAAGIHFERFSAPEKKYIVDSMSAGVALLDYDNDGYPDIYFTNCLTVEAADRPKEAPSTLYHNNGDGTFRVGQSRLGAWRGGGGQ